MAKRLCTCDRETGERVSKLELLSWTSVQPRDSGRHVKENKRSILDGPFVEGLARGFSTCTPNGEAWKGGRRANRDQRNPCTERKLRPIGHREPHYTADPDKNCFEQVSKGKCTRIRQIVVVVVARGRRGKFRCFLHFHTCVYVEDKEQVVWGYDIYWYFGLNY